MAEKALGNNTYEDYLALEAESDVKYEFHDGFIVAMAGGTPEHGIVAMNFGSTLNLAFQRLDKPCGTLSSDVKIHIEAANRSYYPDVSVVCGTLIKNEKDTRAITNPTLILEVLSPSTEAFDRGDKFHQYTKLTSLKEYVLINPSKPLVETFYRNEEGLWHIQTKSQLDDIVLLRSLGIEIKMADIYRRVPGVTI